MKRVASIWEKTCHFENVKKKIFVILAGGLSPPQIQKFKHGARCSPIFLLSLNTKIKTVGWIGAELWTDFRPPHPRKAANFHKICIFNELGGLPPVCRNLNMNHSVARSFPFILIPNLSGYAQWVLRYKMLKKKCCPPFLGKRLREPSSLWSPSTRESDRFPR